MLIHHERIQSCQKVLSDLCPRRLAHGLYRDVTDERGRRPGIVAGLGSGVAWVHGTPLGIATSDDGGATWKYLRDANIIYQDGVTHKTYWAPAVVEHEGLFHILLLASGNQRGARWPARPEAQQHPDGGAEI